MHLVDLSGTWRAAIADEERRRTFALPGEECSEGTGWCDIEVPGHWRCTPELSRTDGPLLYRQRFDLDHHPEPARWWLVLDGVFYQGDVWLDGHYLGDTEGYFFPHAFDVTEQVRSRSEHLLAVEVACDPQRDKRQKRNLTGSLQHATWIDPAWNPGGIWRPVRLESSGPLRIRHLRVRCTEASPQRATLTIRAVIDAAEPGQGLLRSTLWPEGRPAQGRDHELRHVLATGENRIEWSMDVDDPLLWWPRALGEQPLYQLCVAVFAGEQQELASDRRELRTGLRSVRLRQWITYVNGERLFLKGTNLGPTHQALGLPSPEEVVADLRSAEELGLDLVRVHTHVARPELYDAADQAGMLVWQDLPLQWAYSRSVRRQAVRQAREAVDLLGHHPSIAIWCAHNEPLAIEGSTRGTERRRQRLGQALPSWNRSVLDRTVRRSLRTADGTRPVVAHSGMLPALGDMADCDSHLWFGWEYGEIEDLARYAALWPRLVRFVSELGAQAVPHSAEHLDPQRWPDLDWDLLVQRHGLRPDLIESRVGVRDHPSFDAWRDATQGYQAELLRRQIEVLRLRKYRPTGGFAQFLLADAHPAISHSILDHRRRPKAAFDAVAEACRPVIVLAEALPGSSSRGSRQGIYLVSDLRHRLEGVRVSAQVSLPGTPVQLWRWEGDLAADSSERVGTITIPTPRASSGTLALRAQDRQGRLLAGNRYALGSR